jgi:hypothetical protein
VKIARVRDTERYRDRYRVGGRWRGEEIVRGRDLEGD